MVSGDWWSGDLWWGLVIRPYLVAWGDPSARVGGLPKPPSALGGRSAPLSGQLGLAGAGKFRSHSTHKARVTMCTLASCSWGAASAQRVDRTGGGPSLEKQPDTRQLPRSQPPEVSRGVSTCASRLLCLTQSTPGRAQRPRAPHGCANHRGDVPTRRVAPVAPV